MPHGTEVLLSLFVAFVAAQIGGEISQRLRMPVVVGQIAAGVLIGPSVLGWLPTETSRELELLAELGAILLLFSVGLETRLHDLRQVGKVAALVGTLGVAVPFVLGAGWALLAGMATAKALFVAAAFVATSAGITAKVLQELGVLGTREARVVMGAAVIDDVLAMLLLVVVSALQTEAGVDVANLVKVLVQAVLFVVVVAVLGTRVMQRSSRLMDAPLDAESPLTISFAICLGLAVAAANIGLAAIIGAFLAGMVLAETRHRSSLEHDFGRVSHLIVPFFFVATGAKVDVRLLASPSILGTVLVVTILAALGKLIGCGLGARSMGNRSALIVGVGMIPRGEVGVIVASLGEQAGVFSPQTYAVIVGMALLTSVVAPPALKRLMSEEAAQTIVSDDVNSEGGLLVEASGGEPMATRMSGRYLTIYTSDRERVLGELSGPTWDVEQVDGGVNHVLSGVASDGTYDEFLRLNASGMENVAFDFEGDAGLFQGSAVLLRPANDGSPGGNVISIEASSEPKQAT
jgi:Kef-type K+ transport system membrane component KefB